MNSDTPRKLTRSSSDKVLGGVAGGLAEYFSVDPLVVRIGFVASLLFSGAGALAYLALLIFVPGDSAPLTATPMAT
jgi:phage shock protein C